MPQRIAEQNVVRIRHQRRTLPAGGTVGTAKIADDKTPHLRGDQGRVKPLNRVGWIVKKRLPMGSHRGQIHSAQSRQIQRLLHRNRISQRDCPAQVRQGREGDFAPIPAGEDLRFQLRWVVQMMMLQQPGRHLQPSAFNADQRDINAISAGTAHNTGNDAGSGHAPSVTERSGRGGGD